LHQYGDVSRGDAGFFERVGDRRGKFGRRQSGDSQAAKDGEAQKTAREASAQGVKRCFGHA
jgi:hypothetical protein